MGTLNDGGLAQRFMRSRITAFGLLERAQELVEAAGGDRQADLDRAELLINLAAGYMDVTRGDGGSASSAGPSGPDLERYATDRAAGYRALRAHLLAAQVTAQAIGDGVPTGEIRRALFAALQDVESMLADLGRKEAR